MRMNHTCKGHREVYQDRTAETLRYNLEMTEAGLNRGPGLTPQLRCLIRLHHWTVYITP